MKLWNRLEIVVLAPIVVSLLLIGVGLFLLLSNSVSNFARQSIAENLNVLALAAQKEADSEIDQCNLRGVDCLHGAEKAVHQTAVFEYYEDFAREHGVGLIVAADGLAKFTAGVEGMDVQALLRSPPIDDSSQLNPSGEKAAFVQSINFAPWDWRIVLVKQATAFESLMTEMRAIYLGAGVLLLLITLTFVFWLRHILVRPIDRIVRDLDAGRIPEYKGIQELEYLSNHISDAMAPLKAKELQLETTLQNVSEAVTVFDADLRLIAWNDSYARIYRTPRELLMRPGVTFADIARYYIERGDYGDCDPEVRLSEMVDRVRKLKNMEVRRLDVDRKDGTSLEIRRAPLPGGGFVSTYTNVTDRKQATKLQIANQAKSQFLQNMSHDLRKPVTAIIEDAQLLLDAAGESISTSQRYNLESIRINANHLLSMVDGLLEISRIEAGQIDVKPEAFEIGVVIAQTRRVIDPLAKKKGLVVEIDFVDELEVITDIRLLSRILINLASNAVEYTHEGTIAIATQSLNGELVIRVTDTGVGIPEDKLDLIFEKFQRVESTAGVTKAGMGLGLGLAICREFVHLLGGKITVESTLGKGTVFTIIMPMKYDLQEKT